MRDEQRQENTAVGSDKQRANPNSFTYGALIPESLREKIGKLKNNY